MFSSKTQSVVEVCVIENDVTMGMGMVSMNSKHILIIAFQKTVAQFLANLQGLFGCDLVRSETLNYVVCKNCCPSCSAGSDGSKVGGSTSAVGSAGIRLHI